MARPSIFVGTVHLPPLILKQTDLYCKNILTHILHIDLTLSYRDIFEFLQKGYKLCMNWRLDLTQTILLLFGCFWKFLSLNHFANDLYTLYNQLNTKQFKRFQKHENMWICSQTQYWTLFFFFLATFIKTAIKPKFIYRFSLKNFSAAIDHCSIKSPNFASIENFLSCLM